MEKVPEQKSIFRYRSFLHSDVNSLIQQIKTDTFTIRLAHPREFNDTEDTEITLNLDPDKNLQNGFIVLLETCLCNLHCSTVNQIPPNNFEEKQNAAYSALVEAIQGKHMSFEENGMTEEQAQNVRMTLSFVVENFISVQHTNLSYSLSDTLGICCFSEDVYNKLMWAHYGGENRGYCLEYDALPITEIGKSGYGFSPVIYSDNRVDQTDRFWDIAFNHIDCLIDFVRELANCETSLVEGFLDPKKTTAKDVNQVIGRIVPHLKRFGTRIQEDEETIRLAVENCFIKERCWESEKEWRLVMPLSPNASEEERQIKLSPKAIYFGLRMKDEEINEILRAISSSGSNITPYKMQMNIHTHQLEAIRMIW